MPMPSSVAALRALRRRSIHWEFNTGLTPGAGGSPTWSVLYNQNPYGGADAYLPFQENSLDQGVSSQSSYTFGGFTYEALPVDCTITGMEVEGGRYRMQLLDLMWLSRRVNAASTITVNSPTLPARDLDESTNGRGCALYCWVTNASTVTVSYTNSDNVSGRSSALAISGTAGMAAMPLQAGDTGVRSIQSINNSGATAQCVAAIVRLLGVHHDERGPFMGSPTVATDGRKTSPIQHLGVIKAGALLFPTWGYNIIQALFPTGATVELAEL